MSIREFYGFVENDTITFQSTSYIEDGWYIELIGEDITLYEIPFGGGEPYMVSTHKTLMDAIVTAGELT